MTSSSLSFSRASTTSVRGLLARLRLLNFCFRPSRMVTVNRATQFAESSPTSSTTMSYFFYGTLMHPAILTKVIARDGADLRISPAILKDHIRLRVKGLDYPAVIPYLSFKSLFNRDLDQEERSVRGILVDGLSPTDVQCLDAFEGDEYISEQTRVYPLAPYELLTQSSTVHLLSPSTPLPKQLPPPKSASVYIWNAPLALLESIIWSYNDFVREKALYWIETVELGEQDQIAQRYRDAAQINSNTYTFGHAMLKHFNFAEGYINLNNGSYGSLPRSVLEAVEAWGRESEARPDKFIRRTYEPILEVVRGRVAQLIGADTDECVLVPNTTHGIHTILDNFDFNSGDIIIAFTTTYGAVSHIVKRYADKHPHPTISIINLALPQSHSKIVRRFQEHIQSLPRKSGQRIIAIIDAIISNPGAVLPWEEMVRVCQQHDIWSLVDAAHCIGQIPINLTRSQPDFWFSNCHKWLYSKRATAVMYVPKRNQHIIKSSFPTSVAYLSPDHDDFPSNFVAQFDWNGTRDIVPYLSILPALDFRRDIGGEEKIYNYCRSLALEGGKRMAEILGTHVLDESPNGELTAYMVDVLLPARLEAHEVSNTLAVFIDRLLEEYNCFVTVYAWDGQWWARASAQIWLELSDFEFVAQALLEICKDVQPKI